MIYWPVPNSYLKKIPSKDNPGSFWESRGDRFHAGVDIYAPENSDIIAIEDGIVVEIDEFTSPKKLPYWNKTYYILIRNKKGYFYKYAELGKVNVKIGEKINSGQLIGWMGLVLNSKKITKKSPKYIQEIKKNNKMSMLHLELYKSKPKLNENYLGGNIFNKKKPKNLLHPEIILTD